VSQKKIKNSIFSYVQIAIFGLTLIFAPCSVRNSIQESLNLEKTGVTNKSQATTNSHELCSTSTLDNANNQLAQLVNTTPTLPTFAIAEIRPSSTEWIKDEDVALSQYQAPYTVKDKTPLYLLHQQFKTYLPSV
jgi:hypothetical protein